MRSIALPLCLFLVWNFLVFAKIARVDSNFLYALEENEMMRNGTYSNEGSKEIIAFVAGALIGAGVAMLLAPQQGTELRGRLRDYANRAKDELLDMGQEAWDTAVAQGMEYYKKGEEAVRDVGRSAKEFANQVQDVSEGRQR